MTTYCPASTVRVQITVHKYPLCGSEWMNLINSAGLPFDSHKITTVSNVLNITKLYKLNFFITLLWSFSAYVKKKQTENSGSILECTYGTVQYRHDTKVMRKYGYQPNGLCGFKFLANIIIHLQRRSSTALICYILHYYICFNKTGYI